MTEIITYSLRTGRERSDSYYHEAAAFTDQVQREALTRLRPALAGRPAQPPTYRMEEQIVELLTLGILWRAYGPRAAALPALGRRWLSGLASLRRRGGWAKRTADLLRGVLGTLLLLRSAPLARSLPSLTDLDRLLGWMEATGEYRQESERLAGWRSYWAALTPADLARQMAAVLAFAAWFEERAEAVLGRYTPAVERYLNEVHPRRRWREDLIATGKGRAEYHLNMVGAELMNRAYRDDFLEAPRKVVLAPACMRAPAGERCGAERRGHSLRCTGCTAGCPIHQLTQLGRRHRFEVRIITHSSAAFAEGELDGLSIVGIGCVSTLLSGGWKARSLGLPAQCVLLDYCGCKAHWHPTGIATAINLRQLQRVLHL